MTLSECRAHHLLAEEIDALFDELVDPVPAEVEAVVESAAAVTEPAEDAAGIDLVADYAFIAPAVGIEPAERSEAKRARGAKVSAYAGQMAKLHVMISAQVPSIIERLVVDVLAGDSGPRVC